MQITLSDKYKGAIKGDPNAKVLFAVVAINEDHEDTTHELFQANDEDHLKDVVKADFVGEPDHLSEALEERFEDEWGIDILWFEIGTV